MIINMFKCYIEIWNILKSIKIKLPEAAMSEVKNTLDEIKSRLDMAETNISELKDITVETLQIKTEHSELWEKFKWPNICGIWRLLKRGKKGRLKTI